MLIALGAVGLRVRIHLSPRRWELENVHVVASTSSYRFARFPGVESPRLSVIEAVAELRL